MANTVAPEGQVFVCAACGKTSPDHYGRATGASPGWDVSCVLHAVFCWEQKRAGEWRAVETTQQGD